MVRCTARARAGSGMRMVESMKSVRALIVDDSSDLIKAIEQSPDTVITLLNGEEILVQEPVNEIVARIVEFRRRVFSCVGAWYVSGAGPSTSSPDEIER